MELGSVTLKRISFFCFPTGKPERPAWRDEYDRRVTVRLYSSAAAPVTGAAAPAAGAAAPAGGGTRCLGAKVTCYFRNG
jgi:hypothetical protein